MLRFGIGWGVQSFVCDVLSSEKCFKSERGGGFRFVGITDDDAFGNPQIHGGPIIKML